MSSPVKALETSAKGSHPGRKYTCVWTLTKWPGPPATIRGDTYTGQPGNFFLQADSISIKGMYPGYKN